MKKTVELGSDRIKKICAVIQEETLEPAKNKAAAIIAAAEDKAKSLIAEAEKQAQRKKEEANKTIGEQEQRFQSSMEQAAKQLIALLKQEIEKKTFNQPLAALVENLPNKAELAAKLVEAMITAIKKNGISADFSAAIPQAVSVEEVNSLLSEQLLLELREKSVSLGEFGFGVQIKLHDKKMTLDLSDKVLTEILANYLRKDFRKWLFTADIKP